MTNIPPVVDAISTSTQSNNDNFNENSSTNERESLDQIMTHGSEQNFANTANNDEKTSALDLYQKPG
ncbi:hypothetical protein NL492_27305, partial [Klebsiella pneumoniae]|nr:hypothetical protein [Klebsiella pneumoniae]